MKHIEMVLVPINTVLYPFDNDDYYKINDIEHDKGRAAYTKDGEIIL